MLNVKVDFVRDLWAFRSVYRLRAEESGNGNYDKRNRDATEHNS